LDKNGLTQLNGTPDFHFLNILIEFNLIIIKFRIKLKGNLGIFKKLLNFYKNDIFVELLNMGSKLIPFVFSYTRAAHLALI
jgi:hypothetical protein